MATLLDTIADLTPPKRSRDRPPERLGETAVRSHVAANPVALGQPVDMNRDVSHRALDAVGELVLGPLEIDQPPGE